MVETVSMAAVCLCLTLPPYAMHAEESGDMLQAQSQHQLETAGLQRSWLTVALNWQVCLNF